MTRQEERRRHFASKRARAASGIKQFHALGLKSGDVLRGAIPAQSPEAARQLAEHNARALADAEADIRQLKVERAKLVAALRACATAGSIRYSMNADAAAIALLRELGESA